MQTFRETAWPGTQASLLKANTLCAAPAGQDIQTLNQDISQRVHEDLVPLVLGMSHQPEKWRQKWKE